MESNESPASILYELGEYEETDRQVEVTYIRQSDDFIYKRHVNIPHLEDGSINQEYFNEILEGQLNGVINKSKIGIVEFVDPNSQIDLENYKNIQEI